MMNLPHFLIGFFFARESRNPRAISGNAIVPMSILKPSKAISQAVTVVPIFAPMMTPIDSARDNSDALAKLTTINVVAEDDCMMAVMVNPVITAMKRLEVALARKSRMRSPATCMSASLMIIMP